MAASKSRLTLALLLMLGVRLPWFKGSTSVTSESGSDIFLDFSKGVSSFGAVWIATGIVFCSFGEGRKERYWW